MIALAENAERQKTAALRRTDPNPDKVSRLIDIQAKLASGKGAGYERWVKVFNLKQLSKSVALLSEHGVHTEAELLDKISRFKAESSESLAVVKDLETRIDENRELKPPHFGLPPKPEGCPAGQDSESPGDFSGTATRAELTAYQAAAAYFKAQKITKLPNLKQLKAEREE